MEIDFCHRIPMQPTEEWYVLKLHMGVELAASNAICRTDSKANQFCAKPANPSICRRDGKT